MTTDHTEPATAVRLRSDGPVDEQTLTYARTKIDVLVSRAGLPAVTGEVRIVRATAHHAARPWSATADLYVGGHQVIATAEEATGAEVVDRLQDRLHRRIDKTVHAWDNGHRTSTPPWRGAGRPIRPGAGSPSTPQNRHTA
ncbi:hypothetical protein [Streptomyces sp. TLI_146]|uniref:hypothetical protein n=1 Tax=Streptomyces sp. TLI_146 TaxID=1938858 RepID=UPI000C704E62|nr:hypothetical protein [Streptomyces sp. TLI_146]PKV83135.1 hypothetical protein BX283_0628 [Streptomyces sp. TLI_146]